MGKIVTPVCLSLSMISCVSEAPQQQIPVTICICYDLSLSVRSSIPRLHAQHLDSLVSILEDHSGQAALSTVTENSFRPTLRLQLEGKFGKRLDERAAISKRNKVEIDRFRAEALQIIQQERTARISDVYGAIKRLLLVFEENQDPTAKKFLLLLTDLDDDAHLHQRPSFSPDVRIITVGVPEKRAKAVCGPKVHVCESIDAAFAKLRTLLVHQLPAP